MAKRYWLMKSEPDVYSIDDLERDGEEFWDGVRNYQARNFMREMKKGDLVLFYHSNTKPPGVAGIGTIAKEAHPDPTQFDPQSPYFDKKPAKDGTPRWDGVVVAFQERFDGLVRLVDLKADPELSEMRVVQKGSRLSVTPVEKSDFSHILKMADSKTQLP